MPNPRMKDRRVVHKSTAGILTPIPEAVDLVGNPPPGLTTNTVAPLQQQGLEPPVRSVRTAAFPLLLSYPRSDPAWMMRNRSAGYFLSKPVEIDRRGRLVGTLHP